MSKHKSKEIPKSDKPKAAPKSYQEFFASANPHKLQQFLVQLASLVESQNSAAKKVKKSPDKKIRLAINAGSVILEEKRDDSVSSQKPYTHSRASMYAVKRKKSDDECKEEDSRSHKKLK